MMRSTRKFVTLSLVVLVVVAMMFTITACFGSKKHEHSYSAEVVAPTCTEKGYTKYTCSCGDSYTENETPAAHKMTQVARKDPTCKEAGAEAHVACSVCGYVEGEKIVLPAIGHLYEATYVYPTATEAGSKTSVCTVCGDTQTVTLDAFGITLPNISEVLANVIGTLEATLEVTEGSEVVYVTEVSDATGSKQALFVEIAEAAVDGSGETLKAHLKVKIGFAETTLTGLVPSKEVVVDKNNADYYELTIFVNGEDVSVTANDQNAEFNLSEVVYTAIAAHLGYEDVNGILEVAYLQQEFEKLMPLIEKAFGDMAEDLPTVSPEYSEHLEELFALLGEEIVTVTVDNKTGNTTYSLNIVALKKLFADIEDKTLAEYLESVYGENVVASMSSFLKSMPDKTVKDVVNAAVTLADGTDVAIEDVYTLIDLYIYYVTGQEFSIEAQISEHYNQTLVELLAELNGVPEADRAAYIASVKESFVQTAEYLETVSVETLLSTIFVGADEGFFDAFKSTIDMLDEQIVYNFTVDANGNLVSINYALGELQYEITVNGDEATLNITLPEDVVINVVANNSGFDAVITAKGEQIGSMSLKETQVIDGKDIIYTYEIDIRDDMNDLFDYKLVTVNDVTTEFNLAIRGYDVLNVWVEDPSGEWGEWVETKTFETKFAVEYDNLFEEGEVVKVTIEDVELLLTVKDNNATLVVTEDGKQVGSGTLTQTQEIQGEDVIDTVEFELLDEKNELLVYNTTAVNGVITQAYVAVKGYIVDHDTVYDPELEEYVDIKNETYVTWLEVTYADFGNGQKALEFNAHDELHPMTATVDQVIIAVNGDQLSATLYKDGEKLKTVNFSTNENTLLFEVLNADGQHDQLISFTVVEDGDSVSFDVLFEAESTTLLDGVVTVTSIVTDNGSTLTIDFDIDQFLIGETATSTEYIEIDGALQFKVS